MKDKLFGYSKDRPLLANIIIAILSLLGLIIVPSLIELSIEPYIKNEYACLIIADSIYILIMILVFLKDIISEAKVYFSDFKNKFKYSFKLYILGYMGMIFFNIIIMTFLKNISSNEEQVREMLYHNVVLAMISISIIAPIAEELVFRKSIAPAIRNKWIYAIVSGLLFGGAHILTNIVQGIFVPTDLIYILPYGCLGFTFALMDYDNKTVFSSIVIHALHNTLTALLLLVTYFGGK